MLYVDSNEYSQAKDVIMALKRLNTDMIIKPLRIGDYLIVSDDLFLIERKSVSDFLNSVNNGHLSIQLRNVDKYGYSDKLIIVVEGNLSYASYRKFNIKRLMSILHSLSRKYLLISTPNATYTANYINWLNGLSKSKKANEDAAEFFRRTAPKSFTMEEKVKYVAQGFAGVKTAERLLKHFGNIKNIVNASEDDLLEVEGIGKKTAKSLYELFNYNIE
ncbi:MAG: ERCC4 domain-containing protein [Candidatus Odinarchaeia archaeon]